MCAVSVRKKWNEFIRGLVWIDEILGNSKNVSLRVIELPPLVYRHKMSIRNELEKLDKLIKFYIQWNQDALYSFEYHGIEVYEYNDKNDGNEFNNISEQNCWRDLFEKEYVGNYELFFRIYSISMLNSRSHSSSYVSSPASKKQWHLLMESWSSSSFGWHLLRSAVLMMITEAFTGISSYCETNLCIFIPFTMMNDFENWLPKVIAYMKYRLSSSWK